MKKLKEIPKFRSEKEEREFWAKHDSVDYINWDRSIRNPVLSSLKLSAKPISVRLPESLIASLKFLANKRDVPYQSLLKIFLAERVGKELRLTSQR